MQLGSFFGLCLNCIWLSGILVCDWTHHTNQWNVFFLVLREQACVCVAYIIQANSDLETHCYIQNCWSSGVSTSSFQGGFGDLWSSYVAV